VRYLASALFSIFASTALAETSLYEGEAVYWIANRTGNQGVIISGTAAVALKEKMIGNQQKSALISCNRQNEKGQTICEIDFN